MVVSSRSPRDRMQQEMLAGRSDASLGWLGLVEVRSAGRFPQLSSGWEWNAAPLSWFSRANPWADEG